MAASIARVLAGAAVLVVTATAAASPLAEPGDPATRCARGVELAARGDLPRALLYLTGCDEASLADDLARDATRALRDAKQRLRASQLSELQIVTTPPGLVIELDAVAGEKLRSPVSVWVAAGTHTVRASGEGIAIQNTVTTEPFSRATILLDAGTRPPAAPKDGNLDFSEENALEQTSGPPPDVEHPSLMSDKYRGIAGPRIGPELADPLGIRATPRPRPWLGLRVGGGAFDDGETSVALRPTLAATARFALAERVFLAARLDWSRRGGASESAIDAIGASAGAGYTLHAHRRLALAAIAQLRGSLHFADARDGMPVNALGAGIAAALELAFPRTPVSAGVRLETALTELVPGARDRALLVELGVDWR